MKQIPVMNTFDSAMHRDMATKFISDLKALVERFGSVASEELNYNYSINIVLSGMAYGGVMICHDLGIDPGTFSAMVIATEKYMDKTWKK